MTADDLNSDSVRQSAVGPALPEPASESAAPAPAIDEASLRLLADNSTDILCRQSPDGVFLYLSAACSTTLGYAAHELVGRNLSELVHPDDRSLMMVLPVNASEQSDDRHFAEYRLRRKDGAYIWAQTTSRVIRDERGPVREVIAVIRDITARRRTEDNLRHSERLASVGTLAAGIAHEINNPLGAILMAAHAAREANRNAANTPLVDEMLGQVMDDARRAAAIVRSVLQFARREEAPREPASMREIALKVRQHAMRYAGRRELDIKVRGPDVTPWVMVSPMEIEQALLNLVSNSIDAQATRVHLTVRHSARQQRVTVSVIDNGRGMTPDQLKQAFDPFFTGRSHAGGTGLGLSITQGIVVAHGGTIKISSQPTRGTTVMFDLPVTHAPAAPEPPTPDAAEGGGEQ